jgi:hypothetical protein
MMINDQLERVHATVEKCLETRETMCASDTANARADDCDAMVLGSFLRELQKLGVLPRSKNQIIHESMSLSEFTQKLLSMNIKGVHQQCRKAPFERADLVRFPKSVPDPVLEAHRRHMKRQSEGGIMK